MDIENTDIENIVRQLEGMTGKSLDKRVAWIMGWEHIWIDDIAEFVWDNYLPGEGGFRTYPPSYSTDSAEAQRVVRVIASGVIRQRTIDDNELTLYLVAPFPVSGRDWLDGSAAWEPIPDILVLELKQNSSNSWLARFRINSANSNNTSNQLLPFIKGSSAPEAICRAALVVVDVARLAKERAEKKS